MGKGDPSTMDPIKYTGPKKTDDFLRFAQETAGAWIGLPGQVKELDTLAKEFADSSDAAALVKKMGEAAATSSEETAKYYAKVATKLQADSGFIPKETARLKKMMDDGSVKANKKEQFGRRLNVLSSFS